MKLLRSINEEDVEYFKSLRRDYTKGEIRRDIDGFIKTNYEPSYQQRMQRELCDRVGV